MSATIERLNRYADSLPIDEPIAISPSEIACVVEYILKLRLATCAEDDLIRAIIGGRARFREHRLVVTDTTAASE